MTSTPFDPAQAIRFDIAGGSVAFADGAGSLAAALMPASALRALIAAVARSGAAEAAFAGWGDALGQRVRARLGDVSVASPEAVLDHLGGEIALAGLGIVGFERWGRALVLTVRDGALGVGGDEALAIILRAIMAAVTGQPIATVSLGRDDGVLRLLVTGEIAAEKARTMLGEGATWPLVLAHLHGPGTTAGARTTNA